MVRRIFYTRFNLRCKSLKKDTCNICDSLNIKIKNCRCETEKECLLLEKERHLRIAEELRAEMNRDMQKAKDDDTFECLTYDLEKTLPLPRIPTNIVFYKRQLWLYNCGIHVASKDLGYCFVWVEGEAGRGAQEVGSCLFYYIKNLLDPKIKNLTLWSDSCGGQNRNIKMVLMLKAILADNPNIESITLKYLQSGHTFLPNDTDFSKIETALKNYPRIYTPQDYMNVMKTCRKANPLRVIKMDSQNFWSTEKLEKNITNRKTTIDKNKINWLKIRKIMLKKNKLYSFFMATEPDGDYVEVSIEKKTKGTSFPLNTELLTPLWPNGKEIAQAKLNDHLIPSDCKRFYENLKGNPNLIDDIDGFGVPDFELQFDFFNNFLL